MKKISVIIKFFIFIFVTLAFVNVNATSVSLNELYEIRNDNAQLAEITNVFIRDDDNLNYTSVLSKLPNVESINIDVSKRIDDLTFINNVNPTNNYFSLGIGSGPHASFNLKGINNKKVSELWLDLVSIDNFSDIKNLSNLKSLCMGYLFDSNKLDFSSLSKLSELEELRINGVGINNYDIFFQSINQLKKLHSLVLESTNLQNRDVQYLKSNTYLKEIHLDETLVTDISFLKDMPNIETITLPSHLNDFSVIYELDNIKNIWWNNYAEYNVTSDFVQYLESKNINHTTYYPEIRTTINNLISQAKISNSDDDLTKLLKITKVVKNFATVNLQGYTAYTNGGDTTFSTIVLNKKGVCSHWSSLVDTLLTIVGVESYKVSGFLGDVLFDGERYSITNKGMAHAWNIVTLDGKTYAIDVMNANPLPDNIFDMSTWSSFKYLMLRDPFRIDSYREQYAIDNNLEYNYNFPIGYLETDGYITTRMMYEFTKLNENVKITQKNIWVDKDTSISSLNIELIDGYNYKYYDKSGNIKNSGVVSAGDYIIVKSTNDASYSHKYTIIVNEIKVYEIKLDGNGSIGKNEALIVENGKKYTGLFEPIRYGYKFLGWYTAKEGGELITSDSIVDINKVNTLYAYWKFDNKYIVTTDTNGSGYYGFNYIIGINDIYLNSEEISSGSTSVYEDDSLTAFDKKFAGWYTAKEGGNLVTRYSTCIVASNHTIYAHWVDPNEELYTITVNNSYEFDFDFVIQKNHKISNLKSPTREGYTFKYWTVNGQQFDFNTAVTSDITLTAEWEENTPSQYTVIFIDNSGFIYDTQLVEYGNKVSPPDGLNTTAYIFTFKKENGEIFDFNTIITSNMTILVEMQIKTFTVTFSSNGGSSVASQTVNYNGKATKPSNPTRNGYTFKKWLLNGNEYNFSSAVTSNITLTAEWQKNEDPADETLKELLQDNGYNVSSNYVSKFTIGDSIATIKSKLGNNVTIETDKTIIATGTVIRKGNESYTVVIKGDLNGDGKANSGDLLQMRKYLLEEINLTGAYKEAGIIESIGNIKSLDLLRLRQYLLGEYNFK